MIQAPLSATSVFEFKFRKHNCPSSIKVDSNFAKKIVLRLKKEVIEEEVDSSSIKSFGELAKIQNLFTPTQIQNISDRLSSKELLESILKERRNISVYESLLKKLEGSP